MKEALVVADRGEATQSDDEKRGVTRSKLMSATSSSTCLVDGDMCGESDSGLGILGPGGHVTLPLKLCRFESAPAYPDDPSPRPPEAALSLDVIHCRTMAENKTVKGRGQQVDQ